MKLLYSNNDLYFLKLDPGEEIFESIQSFCKNKKVKSGVFNAIGAVKNIDLSYYDIEKKKYLTKNFPGDFELTSMTGNISYLENNIAIHAHGSISDVKYKTFSGHFNKMTVTGACEITITKFSKKLIRKFDDNTGLNLLS